MFNDPYSGSGLRRNQKNRPDWLARLVPQWELEGARVITFNYDQLVELAWLATTNLAPPRQRSWDLYPAPLTPLTSRVGTPGDVVYDQGVTGGKWSLGCV